MSKKNGIKAVYGAVSKWSFVGISYEAVYRYKKGKIISNGSFATAEEAFESLKELVVAEGIYPNIIEVK